MPIDILNIVMFDSGEKINKYEIANGDVCRNAGNVVLLF